MGTTDKPLVSVVTPTWNRHDLLCETIAHVRSQDYPNVEHVVVSDGPDHELRRRIWAEGHRPADVFTDGGCTRLSLYQLGRNWTTEGPANSFGIGPIVAGLLLARGEYLTWLSDDDRVTPDYLSRLVGLCETSGADFAYSKARFFWTGDRPEAGYDIGADPPSHGQITSCVFRAGLLRLAMPAWGTHPVDIALITAWMEAGARWAFLPEVLFWHRADQR